MHLTRPLPSGHEQSLPNISLSWWRAMNPAANSGSRFRKLLPGVCRHVRKQVRIIAEETIGDAAGLDGTFRIRRVFCIISADVCPERIGMPDEPGSRILLQHRVEVLQTSVVPSGASWLRDLLKVNQDRHVQIGRDRVYALHFRAGRFDLRFDFAEPHRTLLDGLGQERDRIRDCHVNAGKPDEACLDVSRERLSRDRRRQR